ncbi:MAG: hypothetical protein LUC87_05730 [Clostridiales bacterium]|nr:hypothetical protein [Clostridiales bacterium]
MVLLLSACNNAGGDAAHSDDSALSVSIVEDESASASEAGSDPDAAAVDVYPLPFTEQEDASDAFTPLEDVPWGEGEQVTLTCTGLAVDAYAAGEIPVTVSGAGACCCPAPGRRRS